MTLATDESSKSLNEVSGDALRLGTVGALAARIEPQLLRRLRLELEPDLDAGAEAELWFSNLVDFRAPTGVVLTAKALPALRERLAADASLLDAAWRVTSAVHAAASPALRVEEELTYLGLRGLEQPGAEDRARILLRRVIRGLVERRASGLPGWANRALPRLPRELLELEEVGMVAYAAALRLGQVSPIEALGEGTEATGKGWAWLVPPALRLIPMSIRWVDGGIEFGPRGVDKSHPIDIPALLPLSVHVWPGGLEAGPGYSYQLTFSGRSFVPIDGDNAVIQILGGDRITLRLAPRIFVSYARADGEEAAREIVKLLSENDLSASFDHLDLEGGIGWWRQVENALQRVEHLVLVLTPAALNSTNVEREWRYARRQGVQVSPVWLGSDLDVAPLPRWMAKAHRANLAVPEERERLLHVLQAPSRTTRVPFMASPIEPGFVPRPDEYAALKRAVLGDRNEPTAITAALCGAGGYGKTELARFLCHDDDIEEAFDGGILWATLGEAPANPVAMLACSSSGRVQSPTCSVRPPSALGLALLRGRRCAGGIDMAVSILIHTLIMIFHFVD